MHVLKLRSGLCELNNLQSLISPLVSSTNNGEPNVHIPNCASMYRGLVTGINVRSYTGVDSEVSVLHKRYGIPETLAKRKILP